MKKTTLFALGLAGLLFAGGVNAQNANRAPLKMIKRFVMPAKVTENDYLPKTIVFKVSPQFRAVAGMNAIQHPQLQLAFDYLGVTSMERKFPRHKAPVKEANELGQKYADLSLIYQLTYTNSVDMTTAINQLLASGALTYAEPHYVFKTSDYQPNDPKADSTLTGTSTDQHNYLKRIRAYKAWDPGLGGTQGNSSTVIAIVDSGSDLDHPDLAANIYHNAADPINGADDDNDGYIDNYNGWDLAGADYVTVVGDNDPNIMGNNNTHGSHVSGCADAVGDNSTGGVGTAFGCKIMIVKCAADNDTRGTGGEGYIIAGYEGITYAADHGAHIINCSWGGTGGGDFGQDIINYASINKNCLVVAAAGNDAADEQSFPGAYNYVLSVAATKLTSDGRASFSNYNYTVDIGAPGENIYNTYWNNTYAALSGTSMASPVTAGAAALVKAKFPSYTGLQVGQRLKQTSDNYYKPYNASTNPWVASTGYVSQSALQNKMGKGRLDMYRALTDPDAPSVVFTNQVIDDHNDHAIVQNDTIFINGDFINYLAATSGGTVASIAAVINGSYLTVVDTATTLGAISTLSTVNNSPDPFSFVVNTGTPLNTVITFRVLIQDGAYWDQYFFNVTVNVDYINIAINDVATTITSKGKLGWNQDGAMEGLGFQYLGTQMLYEMGLMVGTSTTTVSDCIRGTNGTTADADFQSVVNVSRITPPVVSEFDVHGEMNDAPASPTMNLDINYNAYAWSTPGNTKYVIVEYILKNNGSSTLSNLYAGIAADWDVPNYLNNFSDYDAPKMMGYSYSSDVSGLWAGIQLLTNTAPPNFYAIDNLAGGGGGVDINDAGDYFSTADKYTTLSTMKTQAGAANNATTGGDVLNVMSTGPLTIAPGASETIAFALIAGEDLTSLENSADSAYVHYNGSSIGIKNVANVAEVLAYPNPASNVLNFYVKGTEQGNATVSLINMMGQVVKSAEFKEGTSTLTMDISDVAEGAYSYRVSFDKGKQTVGKLIITKSHK